MQRKVKFFDKLYDTDTLDEEINAWIENYDKELIDVKLTVDREEESDYVLYTATVIYLDREQGNMKFLRLHQIEPEDRVITISPKNLAKIDYYEVEEVEDEI